MKRAMWVVLGAALVSMGFATGSVQAADSVSGQVVTCPAGDPVGGAIVKIFINGMSVGTVTANSNGWWTFEVTPSVSNECANPFTILTAAIGGPLYQPYDPYDRDHCTAYGRTGSTCCEQRVIGICQISGDLVVDDLEIHCGESGAPPCPSN